MADILAEICHRKKADVAELQITLPLAEIRSQAEATKESVRPFADNLTHTDLALIAEIKKASPSKGLIREDFNVGALAKAYKQGGAMCLSVLTDAPYFQGDYGYLQEAKEAVDLPVLQKDFMLEPWQIYHARVIGADCILLIMAALEDSQAAELEVLAHELGLHVLLEVHNEPELHRALKLKSPLLGVNNRNLKTLEIDLGIGEALLPMVQNAGRFAIAESGLYDNSDLLRMQKCGAQAFLIGESLMRQDDVTKATKSILGI